MTSFDDVKVNIEPPYPAPGDVVYFKAEGVPEGAELGWTISPAPVGDEVPDAKLGVFYTTFESPGKYTVTLKVTKNGKNREIPVLVEIRSSASSINNLSEVVSGIASNGIKVASSKVAPSDDQALWVKIRQCTAGRKFEVYSDFIQKNLCPTEPTERSKEIFGGNGTRDCRYKHGVHGYEVLKAATEIFLLCESCCTDFSRFDSIDADQELSRMGYSTSRKDLRDKMAEYLPDTKTLPYLDTILKYLDLESKGSYPVCEDSLRGQPCLYELIWSYWQEQGMLVQTLNAIAMRFQNRRVPSNGGDPLSSFEITPLRPISSLLWGYIQDAADGRRLSVARRAYEYAHEYGLQLEGKAVAAMRPAESRSRFLESFHNLLYLCADYYRENTNRWITPDPYPLLDALRSVHLLLAEGAHNQFGDMPTTARAEMMIEQWLLSQKPMSEFLQSRAMVPYDEPWMGQVDAMRRLMGWPDISSMYFNRLAVYGEQILLSVRWGAWSALGTTSDQAANWALYWKPEIQGYVEAYRAVTGVELAPSFRAAVPVDTTQPGELLRRRVASNGRVGPRDA